MKTKALMTLTTALLVTAGAAQGAHLWDDTSAWWSGKSGDREAPKYSAQEVQLDLFGSYHSPEGQFNDLFNTNIRHGYWGGGAGVNLFLTRNLGLGTDFNISSKPAEWSFDYWVGNLYLRLPLGNSGLAPYIYGGGGRSINPSWEWVYGGGVGLEYRIKPAFGIFSDARFLFNNASTDLNTLTIRAGIRISL